MSSIVVLIVCESGDVLIVTKRKAPAHGQNYGFLLVLRVTSTAFLCSLSKSGHPEFSLTYLVTKADTSCIIWAIGSQVLLEASLVAAPFNQQVNFAVRVDDPVKKFLDFELLLVVLRRFNKLLVGDCDSWPRQAVYVVPMQVGFLRVVQQTDNIFHLGHRPHDLVWALPVPHHLGVTDGVDLL